MRGASYTLVDLASENRCTRLDVAILAKVCHPQALALSTRLEGGLDSARQCIRTKKLRGETLRAGAVLRTPRSTVSRVSREFG